MQMTGKEERIKEHCLIEMDSIWTYANAGIYYRYNYFTGKDEIFKTEAGDIVINAQSTQVAIDQSIV